MPPDLGHVQGNLQWNIYTKTESFVPNDFNESEAFFIT
jgi:hypothetical protein